MPYVARRLMKHGDGVLDDGDVIDDFEEWPAINRQYYLDKGDVEYVEKAPTRARSAESSAEADTAGTEGAATSEPARPPRKTTARKPAARKTTARKTTKK